MDVVLYDRDVVVGTEQLTITKHDCVYSLADNAQLYESFSVEDREVLEGIRSKIIPKAYFENVVIHRNRATAVRISPFLVWTTWPYAGRTAYLDEKTMDVSAGDCLPWCVSRIQMPRPVEFIPWLDRIGNRLRLLGYDVTAV